MKRIYLNLLFLLVLSFSVKYGYSQQNKVSYDEWKLFLSKYVTDEGKVKYSDIIKHSEELNKFLQTISTTKPQKEWTDSEREAYWINAYNAFAIKLVIDNYPIKSIRDIKSSAFKSPLENTFIVIKGKNYSLNDIEKMLIKDYKDSRLHFVLCNATLSAPQLSNKAYLPDSLESRIIEQTSKFINNKERNDINQDGKIEISELFKWNKDEFTVDGKTIIDYLNKYSIIKIEPVTKVQYKKYNWALNQ